MRSRDEVLREFGRKDATSADGSQTVEWIDKPWSKITEAMADRIRELEAQQAASEPVAWALYDYDLTEVVNLTAIADVAQRWRLGYGYTRVVPLYAHPSAAAVRVTDEMVEAGFRSLCHACHGSIRCVIVDGVERADIRNALTAALTRPTTPTRGSDE